MIQICTDGSCLGNPGPGGWAFYINEKQMKGGGEVLTTNNRMEMKAVIEALRDVDGWQQVGAEPQIQKITIVTDSQYVKNGIVTWLPAWKKRGWKKADGGEVKNQDLWQELDTLIGGKNIEWQWVRGHSGHEGNEIANELAQTYAKTFAVKQEVLCELGPQLCPSHHQKMPQHQTMSHHQKAATRKRAIEICAEWMQSKTKKESCGE